MIDSFPKSDFTNVERPKRVHPLRKVLLAAIAAFPIVSEVAAEGTPSARWTTEIQEAEKTRKTEGDAQMAYYKVVENMQGLHLDIGNGTELSQWQYEEFCRELEHMCRKIAKSIPGAPYNHELTPKLFELLDSINRRVNARIAPVTDLQFHWRFDKWTNSDTGDCEEYVLNKMDELFNAGLDPAYFHFLIVGDEKGEGHAVLGVDVFLNGERNTLVFDNLVSDIISLSEMEKKYKGRRASFLSRVKDGKDINVRFFEYHSRR